MFDCLCRRILAFTGEEKGQTENKRPPEPEGFGRPLVANPFELW